MRSPSCVGSQDGAAEKGRRVSERIRRKELSEFEEKPCRMEEQWGLIPVAHHTNLRLSRLTSVPQPAQL